MAIVTEKINNLKKKIPELLYFCANKNLHLS